MIRKFAWPLLIAICSIQTVQAQTAFQLPVGTETECSRCITLKAQMPKEVNFGISLQEDGSVLFSMSNTEWFYKFIAGEKDGITVDIVSKERYRCNATIPDKKIRGTLLKPHYKAELIKNMQDLGGGHFAIKIGTIPPSLKGKEIEGNLVFINDGKICFYTNFLDIPRSRWELLPMGLFADTLMQELALPENGLIPIPYVRQLEFTIPFTKNSATSNETDLKPVRDSLAKYGLYVRKINIRAYSSVEGSVSANAAIQQQRAASVIKALQQSHPNKINSTINALENWMEFYRDVAGTPFADMTSISRQDVKKKLMETSALSQLEPVLQKHRKAVVTLYLDKRSGQEQTTNDLLENKFRQAITDKKLQEAMAIQREVFNRIADNRLPGTYMGRLEIPKEKQFSGLLNNQATYNYLLRNQYDEETITAFKDILQLDPSNGKARYNLCALTINRMIADTNGLKPDSMLKQIASLSEYKIPPTLISRMLLNMNIVLSEYYMSRYEYAKKDKAVNEAVQHYFKLQLTDAELLSLAKYLAHYSLRDMAEKLLAPRIGQINVSEDLLFYYLNLRLFYPSKYETEEFVTLMNNAITINTPRFCRLFRSEKRGGIGFQLLEHAELMKPWCESCSALPDTEEEKVKTYSN